MPEWLMHSVQKPEERRIFLRLQLASAMQPVCQLSGKCRGIAQLSGIRSFSFDESIDLAAWNPECLR
jgi:hypothetical protein